MKDTNPISINYSDEKLRILVEEYITMQRTDFTFKGVCYTSCIEQWKRKEPIAAGSMKSLNLLQWSVIGVSR